MFKATTPKGAQSQDPFWDTAAGMLLLALVFYLKYEAPPDEQNFPMVMELLRAGEVSGEDDSQFSPLDELFDRLEMANPEHIALKYYRAYHSGSAKTLKSIQITLAARLEKPVVIHDREAHGDTLELLRRYRPAGVVHCYSGSAEMAKEVLSLGMYIGFTGVVTFKNARRALEAAAVVPLDRLLVETDCPYMAPEPFRGKRCDSTLLPHTIGRLAAVKGVSPQELADITNQNARRLFGIPKERGARP